MADDGHLLALRARYLFPVVGPPIPDGVLTIRDQRIAAVGENLSADAPLDLGNVAIVPSLVNAHTHLEFNDLSQPLGKRGEPLPTWIKRVIDHRRVANDPSAIAHGLNESLSAGVTLLGEISTAAWTGETRPALDLVLFRELLGLADERLEQLTALAEGHLATDWSTDSIVAGLSPHAPYTVQLELLRRSVALAATHNAPVAMHLAESAEELELLGTGRGPFRTMLEEIGAWREGVIPTGIKPIDYLRMLAASPRALVIHGNYLDQEAISFCAAHRDRLAIVYCPRTHDYFGHAPYPLAAMLSAGVTLCVGTDSRASNPDLNLFDELRFIAGRHPQTAPQEILRFATFNGASMLRNAREHGILQPNAYANLAVVKLPERQTKDPHELLFDPTACVTQTWYHGKTVG